MISSNGLGLGEILNFQQYQNGKMIREIQIMMVMSVAFSDGVTNRRAEQYVIHSCFPFTTEKGVTRSLGYA